MRGKSRISHNRAGAAVEVHGRASDETRALGDQKGDQVGQLFGFADSTQRNLPLLGELAVISVDFARRAARPLRALHDAQAHRVDANAEGGVLVRQHLGQVDAGGA